MALNLGSILMSSARERGDHVAIRLGEQEICYRDLDRAARGIATGLRERGLEPGDHVALMCPNVIEFTQAYFGILYAGCTVVPLNVLLSAPEVTYHVQDSDSRLLIAHPLFADPATKGAEGAGVPVVWAAPDASPALVELAQHDPIDGPHPTRESDTAVILYTSGTTGKPKGAELTHANLLLNSAVVVPRLIPINETDVALATLPLFHSFGQTCIQNAIIAVGGSFTLLPRFTPQDALELMQRDRVTLFAGVPTMYFAILNHEGGGRYDLSSLRFCLAGGAATPVEVMKAFEKKYPVTILEGYGLSETSPVASFNVLGRERHPGSIGYPVWGVDMCIMDEHDVEVPDKERGEICIRGHNLMKGYYKRPDATQEAIRGGWFHSGDIGIRDPDGSYRIVDRKKDMIIRGGFNVYPREIEEVLYAHPAIVEAAVIGVENESHGEEIKAVIVLGPGHTLTPEELIAYTREHLAAYKYPRIIEFVDTLPKGPTGKILKRELR